ncbi:MAG: YebC/PmpR family DNA-binding transcriptional regulator [Patescibacteria group bacterium]
MSGHSKWANIRVRKESQDARRGKIYTKHARLIEMAARDGGDPNLNAKLRSALDSARADSIPSSIMDRAIKKGTGALKDAARMEEILYEAYGPGGTAFLIECLTDNRNRTIANIKAILHRHDGRFAESGSVSWMFARKGVVVATSGQGTMDNGKDVVELQLIDAGAEDIEWDDGSVTVTTKPAEWGSARNALKNLGCVIEEAGLKYVPEQTVSITDAALGKRVVALLEALEGDDDVAEVHTNAELH